MINRDIYETLSTRFSGHFKRGHSVSAYAPGRVEVLGNHTDYNEGFVLSAAIDFGTFFLAAPAAGTTCRLVAGDLMQEVSFDLAAIAPVTKPSWANYVMGVLAGLAERGKLPHGLDGMFLGNVPLGAGLSSSAALEMSAGLAFSALYGMDVPPLDLARIGQIAEHDFAGVKCGLLDQISALFAREQKLVMSDFRTLAVETVPLGEEACFLMCNTGVKHALVDGEYNRRRQQCEAATRHFASVLDHPVAALRDVRWEEWEAHGARLDPVARRRAAHVIGENTRVVTGRKLLETQSLKDFGRLMFESHESSRTNFENSCPELDFLVDTAAGLPGILGARLSGGGFGGSAVALLHPRDAEAAGQALSAAYSRTFEHPCDIRVLRPSAGGSVIAV